MIVIIDNYDSFTYNIVQYMSELGVVIKVYRNDAVTVQELKSLSPSAIIISPGPGSPLFSKVSLDVIRDLHQYIPILGVCLGHQAIAAVFGNDIIYAPRPIHGKTSAIYHDSKGIFKGLPNPLTVTRYHSLVMSSSAISDNLEITAWTDSGVIMGCQHKQYPKVQGVQFHPESLWTSYGKQMLKNFINDI
uniref:Anthranilate synthase component 2 n=1 Tax=Trichogloeopsis pedicellata TaxID=1495610 RepID=A0A1G4P068_9FLOR|nr:Anthranilate synthase component II [Trichogloeopsis pedicellata]SCW24313.1 Anthranilate synthase component II [Trichogloeopsis pedicellata]